jgi:hypothetical protein
LSVADWIGWKWIGKWISVMDQAQNGLALAKWIEVEKWIKSRKMDPL